MGEWLYLLTRTTVRPCISWEIYALEGKLDAAISHTERARDARAGNILAHSQLGELYLAKGRIKDALNEWLEALKIDPV